VSRGVSRASHEGDSGALFRVLAAGFHALAVCKAVSTWAPRACHQLRCRRARSGSRIACELASSGFFRAAAPSAGGPALATTLGLLLPCAGLAEAAAAALAASPPPAGLAPDDALLAALLARRLFRRVADAPAYGALAAALLAGPAVLAPPPGPEEGAAGAAGAAVPGLGPGGARGALVPAAAAALAADGQYGRAGALAVAHMRLHPALACYDGGLALLERYLAAHAAAAGAALARQPAAGPHGDPGPGAQHAGEPAAAGRGLWAVPHAAADVAAALPAACRAALARLRADLQD